MQTKNFSPSININRDYEVSLDYIPTENSKLAYDRISNSYEKGIRSFSLIGSYGTGKSSFVLALEKTLNNKANYFNRNGHPANTFKPFFIVGQYGSIIESFADKLDTEINPGKIIRTLEEHYDAYSDKQNGLLIVVDEFGKFLEHAAKHNPEEEMYFIQQLAEFANNPTRDILLITTLHQSFNDYSIGLSKTQRNEWDKVKGRLVEITFNEPLEQLLLLAADKLGQPDKDLPSYHRDLIDLIHSKNVLPLQGKIDKNVANKLYPLDILAATILTKALQIYGQNERSLFSFLNADDYLGINSFKNETPYYNLANVYDYIHYNFYNLVNSKYVEHSAQWRALKDSINKCEAKIDKGKNEAVNLVKIIGLLNIFGNAGQQIDKDFLSKYFKWTNGEKEALKFLDLLEKEKIIKYQAFNNKYVLFEGTDVDIERELVIAEDEVTANISVPDKLNEYIETPIVTAKASFHKTGTLRHFLFRIVENPEMETSSGIQDGIVELVFNKEITEKKLSEISSECSEAILFGKVKNEEELRELILDLEISKHVSAKFYDDRVVKTEMLARIDTFSDKLRRQLISSLHGKKGNVDWYYKGEKLNIKNEREFNQRLSRIIDDIYYKTPILHNELFNREKVQGSISSARNSLIEALFNNSEFEYLKFDKNKFPPEKSIYLSLLHSTGIHQIDENTGKWKLDKPKTNDKGFLQLWEDCEEFLYKSNGIKQKISGLFDLLKQKPYKLKKGFIDFFVPVFLIAKKNEFLLFGPYNNQQIFIPYLSKDTLDLIIRQPSSYYIKTLYLENEQLNLFKEMRRFLNIPDEEFATKESFIETVKPFLSYYKRLTEYTKQTTRVSKKAVDLREALKDSDDPSSLFFEKIPRALDFTIADLNKEAKLKEFGNTLERTIKELTYAQDNLINELESYLNNQILDISLTFPDNKEHLQRRFENINPELLNRKLRVFYQRIFSPLDDRNSWITSITSLLVGKKPDQFNDKDVEVFKENLRNYVYEMDNISDININKVNKEQEDVLKLEMTDFVHGLQKRLVRFPKSKTKEVIKLEEKLSKQLKENDQQTNVALLIRLLQKEMDDEQ